MLTRPSGAVAGSAWGSLRSISARRSLARRSASSRSRQDLLVSFMQYHLGFFDHQMARPERFELPTSWFVAMRSIQLSYGRAVGYSAHAEPFMIAHAPAQLHLGTGATRSLRPQSVLV